MVAIIGQRTFKLADDEAQFLVDILRRNFLYQQVKAVRDAQHPRLLIEIYMADWYAMLHLLHKAGGWDLTDEQRATVAKAIEAQQVAQAKADQEEATQPELKAVEASTTAQSPSA
jgi:hypothetical protein